MKKILTGAFLLNGKKARIVCTLRDTDGYISITGCVFPYRCKTAHIAGCCHEEIVKAFPKLKKFINLHLNDCETGLPMHCYSNALFHLVNGKSEYTKEMLQLTDRELLELSALAEYGLHKKHNSWGVSCDKQAEELFSNTCRKMGVETRLRKQMEEFYKYCDTIK